MPAEPHWEWMASDGKVYEDVVVTKIEPEMVTIQHSGGVAHLEISMLTPEIQKRLNYDPVAAKAAKVESEREAAHPYYRVAELADAQQAARELHRPLAWMDAWLESFNRPDPAPNSEEDLAHMAVDHLKSRAILIFIDANNELSLLSPVVREQQLFQFDDGLVPGGHHFFGPKIVFTDADVTTPLGRVTSTEMLASREAAIDAVVDAIAQGKPAPVPVPPKVPRTQ